MRYLKNKIMLVSKKVAMLLRKALYDRSSTTFIDECNHIQSTISNENFDVIEMYQYDLNEYERDNDVVGMCYLLPSIGDVIDWLYSKYKLHVEVFVNPEFNDYCCRCWDVSGDKKVCLITRVAYSAPYDAWNGILESTLNYILNK